VRARSAFTSDFQPGHLRSDSDSNGNPDSNANPDFNGNPDSNANPDFNGMLDPAARSVYIV